MAFMHIGRLALVAVVAACAGAAQPSGNCALAGRVVQRGDNEPIRKAAVFLTWHGSPQSVALARTDRSGAFVFEGLPPGRYTLTATREGMGAAAFGDSAEGMLPEVVTVAEGERRGGIIIRLSLAGSISGVVFDSEGEPAQGAHIQVLMEGYPRGTRQLLPVSQGTTNLRGEYQVRGLQPGKYYVLLQALGVSFADDTDNQNQVFRRQYYGGVMDWKQASPVVVASGQQVRGIDIRAVATHSVRVPGRITGAPGWQPSPNPRNAPTMPGSDVSEPVHVVTTAPPFVNVQFQHLGEDALGPDHVAGAGPPDYKFDVAGVIPGRYRVTASLRSADGRILYSRQDIEVGEQPSEIEIALAPPVDLRGTVRYEGDPALCPNEFHVELVSGDQSGTAQPAAAKVNPDGTFVITGVPPGIWDISPGPIPKGGFLKTMRLGKQDVLTEEMEIGPATADPLDIVISSRGAKVEGELEGETTGRRPALIMLAPTGKLAAVMSFFAMANSDGDGKFKLSGLTPGTYRLFAFDRVPKGDIRGPELVKKISTLGEPVELAEAEMKHVRARLITPEQLDEALR